MFSESGVAPTSGPSRTDYATTTGAESSYEFAVEKEIEVVMPKVEIPDPKHVLKNDLRVNRKEVVGILSEVRIFCTNIFLSYLTFSNSISSSKLNDAQVPLSNRSRSHRLVYNLQYSSETNRCKSREDLLIASTHH